MKLTALMVTTTTRMVSAVAWSGVRASVPPPGSGSQLTSAPLQTSTPPAATWPASLEIGFRPHRSSAKPTSTMSPPASSSPAAIRLSTKTLRSGLIREATSSPAASPPYMARPPSSGTGSVHVPVAAIVHRVGPDRDRGAPAG